VLLEVAYDGTAFSGWASQKSARTVQQTLRDAIRAIDPNASDPRGASRTDAGVHAEGQLAAFDTDRDIPAKGWVLGLNQHLPDDVAVRAARAVPTDFNPRFASRGKRYRYRVLLDDVRDPHWRTRAWRVAGKVDRAKLAREKDAIIGTHDFAGLRAGADERASTVRTMRSVVIDEGRDARLISVVIEGDAFLYNMVRILVGTLIDVARGRLNEGAITRAIASKDRRDAGITAPAHGLTLERVLVDEMEGERWPR
jgi:tRNA pseudouridine38-40 synthase